LAAAQQPPRAPSAQEEERRTPPQETQSPANQAESGTGAVTFNPAQPYRPIPVGGTQPRETIWEFYLKALNPRQIHWGDEIDRRLAVLAEQSVGNPYFRLCAFQMGLIVVLLMICWLWWDKMHQIKWVAAECLADAINAKRMADHKALEAIGQYNRHIEMCNRVIEGQESGLPTGVGSDNWQPEMHDLRTQLATERANSAHLEAELKNRDGLQSQIESRIQQLEENMRDRQSGANAELVARLQRAEAELSNRKTQRN
jgi:hypothetical protein